MVKKPTKTSEVLAPLKPKSGTRSAPVSLKAQTGKVTKPKAKPKPRKTKADVRSKFEAPPEPKEVRYQKHFIGLARTMFLAKVPEDEIAHVIGIERETMEWWKEEHPEFGAAFRPDPRNYGGRPTSWDERNIAIAKQLAGLGATDLEIAQAFEVSIRSIHRWKLEYPEFREALEMGKDVADNRVEHSLYQRATGYSFDSEKIVVVEGEPQRVEIIEHVPPDTKAAMFWLQNRRKDAWRAVQHINHDVEKGSPLGSFLSKLGNSTFVPVEDDKPTNTFLPVEEPEGDDR
ncbi:hypothetical protein [Agrobacterium sp. CG674]